MTLNCTEVVNMLQWYYLPTMYSMEFCLGVLGNLLVILAYLCCLKEWKSTNIYLWNLAVSDLIFLCRLPRLANSYAHELPENSPGFCLANSCILHINLYSIILFMVWVNADRYLMVRHPYRQHRLQQRCTAVAVSALTWLIICAQVAPLLYFIVHDLKESNWTRCSDFGSLVAEHSNALLTYSLVLTATGYILPLMALCLASAKITSILEAQAGVFQEGCNSSHFRRPQQIVRFTAAMFLVLYTPYHVMRNVYIAQHLSSSADHDDWIKATYIVTRPIAFAHSVINPVLYFFMGDHLRELLIKRVKSLFERPFSMFQSWFQRNQP